MKYQAYGVFSTVANMGNAIKMMVTSGDGRKMIYLHRDNADRAALRSGHEIVLVLPIFIDNNSIALDY